MFRNFSKIIIQKIKKKILRSFFIETWNVGIIGANIKDFIHNPGSYKINWLPELGGYKFIADPFIIKRNDDTFIFCEIFDYNDKIGKLGYRQLDKDLKVIKSNEILPIDLHLSFPNTFFFEGNYYMIPECYRSKNIILYKATEFPDAWEPCSVLVENVEAIDISITRHEGKWWLFYTTRARDDEDLYIAYSDNLTVNWKLHPQNPVKKDRSCTRSAGGLFKMDENLYRPAQNCIKTYGGSVVINKITLLSAEEFKEEKAFEIRPDIKGQYNKGLHTINVANDLIVIDGKRLKFVFLKFVIHNRRRYKKAKNRLKSIMLLNKERRVV